MTKADLVQILGWRLGDRDDMADRVNLELDYIQDYVLEAKEWLPWFLLSGEESLTITAGVREVALPADFLAEEENSALWLEEADGSTRELGKMDFDLAARRYPGPGAPRVYAVKGLTFQFFPLPEIGYTCYQHYYQKDARISAGGTSKWLEHAGDVVLAELGAIIAEKHIKDQALAAAFKQDAQGAWSRLYSKHTAKQELNQSRSMKGNS